MRVLGYGWEEFKQKWSSSVSEEVGTVPHLISVVKDIIQQQDELGPLVPRRAVPPMMQRKTYKQLGEKTQQALCLANTKLSIPLEELLEKAKEKRLRMEEDGELDRVGDLQPRDAPPIDYSLLGKLIEIRYRHWRPSRPGETGKRKQVCPYS